MSIIMRRYDHPVDYQRVDDFLIRHYQPGNKGGNWIEPAWEYMHFHPWLDSTALDKIAIWEEKGEIVAVVHYESRLGEAFFQFHPAYHHLHLEMLEHAEANLTGISRRDGRKYLRLYVNDFNTDFINLVRSRGYEKDPEENRPLYRFDIPDPFPLITLPEGYRLTSLAEERDWAKVHRVIHRGFNHEGEPPAGEEELENRRRMFETPKARMDLKVALSAPNGDFTAFCGTFYEPNGKFAYVEPVATDPAYRRIGLGKTAVLEGIRRCGALGATVAYVGSDQEFYKAIGFKKVFVSECWVRFFDSR